jgi:hypothetical protein
MADEQTENSSSEEKTEENVNKETVDYTAMIDAANAKIATLEAALEAKDAENLALKAANYDLLMQVGVESNEENSLDEDEEQLTIDDLF